MRRGVLAILGLAVGLGLAQVRAMALDLVPAGKETVLFDSRTDACDNSHHPDAPARAFRRADGTMVLFAPNFRNRAFEGTGLYSLHADCRSRFKAGSRAVPNLLDDRTWLHGFHTADGRRVFAFASASFMPYRHEMPCRAGPKRTDCWLNGLAVVQSEDGGRTFRYTAPPPGHLAFPPPQPYRPDVKDPPGYITATNIVEWKGHLYTVIWRRGRTWEESRNCLARAAAGDLTHWSVWDGRAFTPAAVRGAEGWEALTRTCARIGPRGMSAIRGIVFHQPSATFIAVYQHRRRPKGQGRSQHGIFYSTSKNLVEWSMPRLLLARKLRSDAAEGEAFVSYPSLIDPDSPDRNFGTMDDTAALLFVRLASERKGGKRRHFRELVAVPITVRE